MPLHQQPAAKFLGLRLPIVLLLFPAIVLSMSRWQGREYFFFLFTSRKKTKYHHGKSLQAERVKQKYKKKTKMGLAITSPVAKKRNTSIQQHNMVEHCEVKLSKSGCHGYWLCRLTLPKDDPP